MQVPYDPAMAKVLARCCELTYTQYSHGPPPGNDGKIKPPNGYSQIASFTAPEINFGRDLHGIGADDIQGLNGSGMTILENQFSSIQDVYFGFALSSSECNIIALRGTQSTFEWVADASVPQVPVPLAWFNQGHFELARVHMGFMVIFAFLYGQIRAAASQFDARLPCYITGHSLGAALAVLAPVPLMISPGLRQLRMVNFAGPRVGNQAFADAYNELVPSSYRVVNLSDLVPMLPPSSIFSWQYSHVGEEWSFLNQSGNVAGNHGLIAPNNYTDAVFKQIPTDAPRSYPVTGL